MSPNPRPFARIRRKGSQRGPGSHRGSGGIETGGGAPGKRNVGLGRQAFFTAAGTAKLGGNYARGGQSALSSARPKGAARTGAGGRGAPGKLLESRAHTADQGGQKGISPRGDKTPPGYQCCRIAWFVADGAHTGFCTHHPNCRRFKGGLPEPETRGGPRGPEWPRESPDKWAGDGQQANGHRINRRAG